MQEEKQESAQIRGRGRLVLLILILLVVFCAVVMVIIPENPSTMPWRVWTRRLRELTLSRSMRCLIKDMAGNWLPNDLFWPTVLLDNMPNFQLGVLEVVRYNVRVMRDNLSRMRTTDRLDPNAEAAFTNLSNDPFKWWFPSAESKWKSALTQLETYNQNLASGKAHFYSRATTW